MGEREVGGNCASSTRTIGAQTTSRSYILEATSNKSTGFLQTNLRIYNKFIKDGFRRMPAVRSPE